MSRFFGRPKQNKNKMSRFFGRPKETENLLYNEKTKKFSEINCKKSIKPKHRRGKRRSKTCFVKSMQLLGINAAGIKSKKMTFKKVLSELKPAMFFIEETKMKDIG